MVTNVNSVIVGCGEVGFALAGMLSTAGHHVTVVDNDQRVLDRVADKLDVQALRGDATSPATVRMLNLENCFMMCSVTDIDEVNMISSMMGHKLGVQHTVARIRNPEYFREDSPLNRETFGIDLVVSPEVVAAQGVAKLLRFPGALEVDYFFDNQVKMVEHVLPAECDLTLKPLKDVNVPKSVLILAAFREGEVLVPRGNDRLRIGDRIVALMRPEKSEDFRRLIGIKKRQMQRVMLLGGGRITVILSRLLLKQGIKVCIIESDEQKCDLLASEIDDALVLCGDGTDRHLLMEEHVGQVDAFISLTDNDELNVMSAMLAKTLGAGKVITQVAKPEYSMLVPSLGVDKVFSPLRMTARAIMSYLYGGSAPLSSILEGDLARMLQFRVGSEAPGIGKPLKELRLPEGSVVGVIQSQDKVLVADGESVVEPGDSLLVFALHDAAAAALRLFGVKKHFLGAGLEF